MIFTDNNFELVWGVEETTDFEVSDEIQISYNPELFNKIIDKLQPFIEEIDITANFDDQFSIGYTLLDQIPLMYAARPVISYRKSDQNGYLILVKYIDQQAIDLYGEQLHSTFTVTPINSSELNSGTELPSLEMTIINSEKLSVTDVLQTRNAPVFSITTELTRDISRTGLNSLYLASTILLLVGLLSVVFIWRYLSSKFFKPLEELSNQMQDISSSSDFSKLSKIDSRDEIGMLAKSFNTMITAINSRQLQLEEAQNQLKETNAQLSDLVRQDSLTGVANRMAFQENIESNWNQLARLELPLSILMMDIDYFKDYNDQYGHIQGDICLKQVAQVLSDNLKRSNDFLARYGGEEFIATLAGSSELEAQNIAEAILESIRQANIKHEKSGIASYVTLSIGIATIIPGNQMNYTDLINQADQALYQAKAAGRNQTMTYVSLIKNDSISISEITHSTSKL